MHLLKTHCFSVNDFLVSGAPSPVLTTTLRPGKTAPFTTAKRAPARGASILTRGSGGDAVQGWLDLAKLVSGGGGFKSAFKDLANKIGELTKPPTTCRLENRADKSISGNHHHACGP